MFQSAVLSILTSAVVTLVLSKNEVQRLSTPYYKMLRVLLMGTACNKKYDHESSKVRHSALSNEDVCEKLSMPPFPIVLRILRLRFLQSMIRDPSHHQLFWCAVLGKFDFELVHTSTEWGDKVCCDIIDVYQFDDICIVSAAIDHLYQHQKGLALQLFLHDREMADTFCRFDLRQTRVHKQQATVLGSTRSSGCHAVAYSYDSQSVYEADRQGFFFSNRQ